MATFVNSGSFPNGFSQRRPFTIYIMGPHDYTCNLFLKTVADFLEGPLNSSGDKITSNCNDPEYPVSNSFRITRARRRPGETPIHYSLTCDSSPLLVDPKRIALEEIDAYIVVFRIEDPDDFARINTVQANAVLRLAEAQYHAAKKVLFFVGHKGNVFQQTRGFAPDAMAALLRRTHGIYRYANFRNETQCVHLMELVIEQVIAAHLNFQLQAQSRTANESTSGQLSSVLLDWSSWIEQVRRGIFTGCTPAFHGIDSAPPMTDEERRIHAVSVADLATPMGMALGMK